MAKGDEEGERQRGGRGKRAKWRMVETTRRRDKTQRGRAGNTKRQKGETTRRWRSKMTRKPPAVP